MNYTIAVPIIEEGKVVGCVFGAIYFDDIENIMERSSSENDMRFCLLASDNTVMSGGAEDFYGKSMIDILSNSAIFGTTKENLKTDIEAGAPTSFWQWRNYDLFYTTSVVVQPTGWTLFYQVRFASVLVTLLPVLLVKAGLYIFLSIVVSVLGRRYLKKQLDTIDMLWSRITQMQKEHFQSELTDYNELLEITQKGLTDQITGLSTRTVLLKRIPHILEKTDAHGILLFIDLDDLKDINDLFGHEAGDCALIHFAQVIKQFEKQYTGLSARYGGDEFVLLLEDVEEADISAVADDLCSKLKTTISVNEKDIPIHGSIGVSCFPRHGKQIEDLICKADFALYDAKRNGKSRWSCYNDK